MLRKPSYGRFWMARRHFKIFFNSSKCVRRQCNAREEVCMRIEILVGGSELSVLLLIKFQGHIVVLVLDLVPRQGEFLLYRVVSDSHSRSVPPVEPFHSKCSHFTSTCVARCGDQVRQHEMSCASKCVHAKNSKVSKVSVFICFVGMRTTINL